MTTITTETPETNDHSDSPERAIADAVSAFRRSVAEGRTSDLAALYAVDAVADLTVPNWRYELRGATAIADNYSSWFPCPGHFEEFEVHPTPAGVALIYTFVWIEDGVPYAVHHCHVLGFENGLIQRDTVFCGGRWSATLLAEMEEAARAR